MGAECFLRTRSQKFEDDFSEKPFHFKFSFQHTTRVRDRQRTQKTVKQEYAYNTVSARGIQLKSVHGDLGESPYSRISPIEAETRKEESLWLGVWALWS